MDQITMPQLGETVTEGTDRPLAEGGRRRGRRRRAAVRGVHRQGRHRGPSRPSPVSSARSWWPRVRPCPIGTPLAVLDRHRRRTRRRRRRRRPATAPSAVAPGPAAARRRLPPRRARATAAVDGGGRPASAARAGPSPTATSPRWCGRCSAEHDLTPGRQVAGSGRGRPHHRVSVLAVAANGHRGVRPPRPAHGSPRRPPLPRAGGAAATLPRSVQRAPDDEVIEFTVRPGARRRRTCRGVAAPRRAHTRCVATEVDYARALVDAVRCGRVELSYLPVRGPPWSTRSARVPERQRQRRRRRADRAPAGAPGHRGRRRLRGAGGAGGRRRHERSSGARRAMADAVGELADLARRHRLPAMRLTSPAARSRSPTSAPTARW